MPNTTAHRLGAALVIGGSLACYEHQNNRSTLAPAGHALLAGLLGILPDLIEPASHPNHRQFYHSIGFACVLGYGLYRLYQWETDDIWHKRLKTLGLVAGSAYLVHLAMDATTARSLPII